MGYQHRSLVRRCQARRLSRRVRKTGILGTPFGFVGDVKKPMRAASEIREVVAEYRVSLRDTVSDE